MKITHTRPCKQCEQLTTNLDEICDECHITNGWKEPKLDYGDTQ